MVIRMGPGVGLTVGVTVAVGLTCPLRPTSGS